MDERTWQDRQDCLDFAPWKAEQDWQHEPDNDWIDHQEQVKEMGFAPKNIDFERALMALDQNKLWEFCEGIIGMYVEYKDLHGHSEESARTAGINEVLLGTQSMIELSERGEL